jgi:hypothetical protein
MEPRLFIIGVRVVPGGRPTKENGEEGPKGETKPGKIEGTEGGIEGEVEEEAASGPPAE